MGANGSRQMTYEQYYDAVRRNPTQYADIDPYEVFGIGKNFEWDELKQAYRRVARLVHPDKGGSEVLFNKVTECFKQLATEYKARHADRPHHELRAESQNYYQQNERAPPVDVRGVPTLATDGNFLDRFNRAFEDNRLDDDDNGGGYGHMMEKSTKKREDISVQPILKGKVSADVFNKTFDTVTLASKPSKDVVVYKEPEALPLAKKLQYTELGGEKPDDYSSGVDIAAKSGLRYTDYMKAHTTVRLVDPRTVEKRKNFRSVQEYQNARERVMERPPSEDELRYRAELERKEKEREEARVRRLAEKDQLIANHHARVNQLFLGAALSREIP